MPRKLAHRSTPRSVAEMAVPPAISIDQLFWEDVEPAVHEGRLAVSQELFDRCRLVVQTEEEFEAAEHTLKEVAASIRDASWSRTLADPPVSPR